MLNFKSSDGKKLKLIELTWHEAKPIIQDVDSELAAIMDTLINQHGLAELPLYKVTYPFGAKIIDKGKLYFSTNNGEEVACDDIRTPRELAANLQYNILSGCPLAIALNKNSEVYVTSNNKPYPINIISKGDILGCADILARIDTRLESGSIIDNSIKTIVSGSRSTFLLTKVSDLVNHKKLMATYSIRQDCPQLFQEHWLIFKAIARAQKSEWQSEFLFFSKAWVEYLDKHKYSPLATYFLKKSLIDVNRNNYNEILQMLLGHIDQNYHLKFASNVLIMAKHLFAISTGSAICFRPATNEESMPIQLIQSAYINGYGLTEYCPIIMEPTYIDFYNKESGYYFQNYPILPQLMFEFGARKKSIMEFIKEVQFVTNIYQKNLNNNRLSKKSILNYVSRLVDFSYFHEEPDNSMDNINKIEDVFNEDDRFWTNQIGDFPIHSSMLRGCIKISYKGKL